MPEITECPDCGAQMEDGFIPDSAFQGYLQTHWHRGQAEEPSVFGFSLGKQIDESEMIPVRTFRCPACGLLRSYAR